MGSEPDTDSADVDFRLTIRPPSGLNTSETNAQLRRLLKHLVRSWNYRVLRVEDVPRVAPPTLTPPSEATP